MLQDITVSPNIHDEILLLESSRDITILTGGKSGHAQEKVRTTTSVILCFTVTIDLARQLESLLNDHS